VNKIIKSGTKNGLAREAVAREERKKILKA
jgi:hypothetical protein